MEKKAKIASTQTLFDVALQYFGDATKVLDVITENPDVENIETDLTGMELKYQINNTYAQRYYIAKDISVSAKPTNYANSTQATAKLLEETGSFLVQENGYYILK